MSVHTHEGRLKVVAAVFEARFDEGYRYLDRSGELLVRINKYDPSWRVSVLTQQVGQLTQKQRRLLLNIGVEKIDLSSTKAWDLPQAEKEARELGDSAEAFYELAIEVLKIPRTLRVGIRFAFTAPADSLEEADRFVSKALACPLRDVIAEKAKGQPIDAQVSYVVEDSESGLRRRVQVVSAILGQNPGDPPFLGLAGDVGSGGVVVDVDTYTRPDHGHFPKASLFVQDNYLKARAFARELFAWLLAHQM
jgi:hypothetical protein